MKSNYTDLTLQASQSLSAANNADGVDDIKARNIALQDVIDCVTAAMLTQEGEKPTARRGR